MYDNYSFELTLTNQLGGVKALFSLKKLVKLLQVLIIRHTRDACCAGHEVWWQLPKHSSEPPHE